MLKVRQSLNVCFNFAFRFHAQNISVVCTFVFSQESSTCKVKYRWCLEMVQIQSRSNYFLKKRMFNMEMFFLKSTHEQHGKMRNTQQQMHNLQLGIALMSVQYRRRPVALGSSHKTSQPKSWHRDRYRTRSPRWGSFHKVYQVSESCSSMGNPTDPWRVAIIDMGFFGRGCCSTGCRGPASM